MGDVENLTLARAERDGDCREVLPVDAMRDFIRRVESGEVPAPQQMICCMLEDCGDEVRHYTIAAGVSSRAEALGILFSQMNILDAGRHETF